jgi:MinD-like ATPase involved in chromosome partitioning or flagellar assembly
MHPIVGIHSFRQGGGTSTLTAYLALILAQQGQQVAVIEVYSAAPSHRPVEFRLLQYLNMPVASASVTVKPTRESREENIVCAVFSGADETVKGQVYGMSLAAAPDQPLEYYGQFLNRLSQTLRLDYVLLDLPAGLNESSLMMLGLVDILLIHLCPDQLDFQGTAVTVDIVRRLQVPRAAIVLNQVPDIFAPESLQQQVQELYNLPLLGYLPFAGEIRLATPYVTFFNLKKSHPFRNELEIMGLRLQALEDLEELEELGTLPTLSTPVTLLDVLMLPDAERQLTNWLIHRGPTQVLDVAHFLNTSASIALGILEKLVSYGIVERINQEGDTYYRTILDPP